VIANIESRICEIWK